MQDCTQVPLDGKRLISSQNYGVYDGSISDLNPPVSSEIKDGQWLGVEVKSQAEGGKVIVCAHRYTIRDVLWPNAKPEDDKRGMIGLCYVLQSDLDVLRSQDMGYKSVMVIREAVGGKRQEPKPGFDDHAKWGVCQIGVSVAFVEDQKDQDQVALFGAPGCFAWRGNLISQTLDTLQPYQATVNENSFRQYAKHGLMGVAVATGRFFDNELYYAAGAPHANSSGHVYFFSPEGRPRPEVTLIGEDYGAAFGLSLASCNVNGDSSPDLLVGAPFFDDDKSHHERGGAVYLYLSKNRQLSQSRRLKIVGRELLGQFGLSLTCMGDMNKDGYEDFAIGAPYESNGGSVYVFFGGKISPSSPVWHAEKQATQIILAENYASRLPRGLSTFGSSLSGGRDMDGNGYPDLLVGAYASSAAFLFRSRPIMDISTYVDDKNLHGIDPGQTGCAEDPSSSDACFGFAACFKISQMSRSSHSLQYLIEAEPQKPVSRIYLRRPNSQMSEKNSSVEGQVLIAPNVDGHQCINLIGYVSSTHLDLQTPVHFQMSYHLVQQEPQLEYNQGQDLPSLEDFPILDQAEAKRKFQATFEKDCGDDDTCKTHLVIKPTLRDKAKELGRTPTGEAYELELGSLEGSELLLDVEVINKMEPAYEASLDVYFPEALQYIGFLANDQNGSNVLNTELKNSSWLSISLGNPFKTKSHLHLRFQPQPSMNDKLIVFFLTANTSSEMLFDASTFLNLAIVRRAEVRLMGTGVPELVHYGGQVLGENAFNDLSQVGPPLVHKFLVINNGPSQLDVLRLHIRWPFQVENGQRKGKWLLYLSEHPTLKNGRGVCYLPPGQVANPLNLTSTLPEKYVSVFESQVHHRGKRSIPANDNMRFTLNRDPVWVEKVVAPRTVPGGEGRDLRVITLDCDRGTAKCLEIQCDVYNLPVQVSATIEVRSRLWNSTLMEDYGTGIDLVEIFTKAEIKVDGDISQYVGDDFMSIRTVAEADIARQRPSLFPDWWIIIVSILAGLLVLVIISSVLWKLGFFKRQRPVTEDNDSDLMMSAHFEKVRLNSDY